MSKNLSHGDHEHSHPDNVLMTSCSAAHASVRREWTCPSCIQGGSAWARDAMGSSSPLANPPHQLMPAFKREGEGNVFDELMRFEYQ